MQEIKRKGNSSLFNYQDNVFKELEDKCNKLESNNNSTLTQNNLK